MKAKFAFILLLLASCGGADDFHTINSKTPTEIKELERFNEYINFFYEDHEESQEMSKEIKETYIKQALDLLNEYYRYEVFSDLEFTFNEVLHKSSEMVAVSFNIHGDDGMNMYDVDFMLTYNISDGSLVDVMQIGSSTDFESYSGKGYNTIYSLNFELINESEGDIAFVVRCEESRLNYNFNPSYYTSEEIEGLKTEVTQKTEYTVSASGVIVESQPIE